MVWCGSIIAGCRGARQQLEWYGMSEQETTAAELRTLSEKALQHQHAGRFAEAAQVYAALLARAPHAWIAAYNLGLVYQHLGRLPEAAEMYVRAVRANPKLAEGYNNLGNVLKSLDRQTTAIEAYEKALALNPQLPEASYNLAIMLQSRGQFEAAIEKLRATVAQNPAHGNAWDSLYRSLLGQGRQDDAIEAFLEWERSADLSPELVVAGLALCRPMGDPMREQRYLALALAWRFEFFTPEQFAPVLGMIQYFDVSGDEMLQCYRRYDSAVSSRRPPQIPLLPRRAADARIRIGYLSGDFRHHVMGHMLLQAIARHDREKFSVLLISTCAANMHDAITSEYKRIADGFADISGLDDFAAARSIAEVDIDVLVDLAGQTNSARPGIYAHRPARTIVTHLGYHGCVGLIAVDYKLTDHLADRDDAGKYQIERPFFLDSCVFPFVRVLPNHLNDKPGTIPELEGKFVFGAFLNILKLSPRCLNVWCRVLETLPESILLFSPLDPAEKTAIHRVVASAGINPARTAILVSAQDDASLRGRYRHVHAVMDTFPYAGGDTTLAALDMGVPVVTLTGERHSERIGASILTHLSLGELVANSEEQFIAISIRLARDEGFMADMRRSVANATAAAADNSVVYTRALEKAFVEIAARKPVTNSMSLTGRQFFTTFHDALQRQSNAKSVEERQEISAIFLELQQEQPDYSPLLRAQSQLALEQGNLSLASSCLASLLEQFPNDNDARLTLAGVLIEQGSPGEALGILDHQMPSETADVRVLKSQIRAHGRLRQWDAVRLKSEQALEIAPADADALFWHGTALSHIGDTDGALTFLNRALILAPQHAEAAFNAGVLLAESGNHVDAEKVLRRALKTDAAPQAHLYLLHNFLARGRRDDWMVTADQFVGTYPTLLHARLVECRIARLKGDLAREAEILLPLAEEASMLDSDAAAIELIGEILSILPHHDVARQLIQRLHTRYLNATRVMFPIPAVLEKRKADVEDARIALGYLVDFSIPFVERVIIELAIQRDRARFNLTVYALSPSNLTPREQLESLDVKVVSLAVLDEYRAAKIIRDDSLDALIDTSGFGHYAKPCLLSLRPAVTQIGLPGYTKPGPIGDLDYRISDQLLELTPEPDAALPAPLYLEGCVFAIQSPSTFAPIATRTSIGIENGAVTFGVLASVEHISIRCVGLWKQLSDRVPNAVFVTVPQDAADIEPIGKMLIAAGIDHRRIFSAELTATLPNESKLSDLVDIVLDTLPANDYVSVRASIIEGLPLATMRGRSMVERVSMTIMSHLGLSSVVVQSGRDYIDLAVNWASNPGARSQHSAKIAAAWKDASRTDMPFSMGAYTRNIEMAVSRAVAVQRHPSKPDNNKA